MKRHLKYLKLSRKKVEKAAEKMQRKRDELAKTKNLSDNEVAKLLQK